MIRRQLSKALKWMASTLKKFLDNPLRVINAAGLAMGAIFIAIVVVMIVAMFSKALAASALAVVIAPELTKLALGLLLVVSVVIMVQLGFKDFDAEFMGAKLSARVVAAARQMAQNALGGSSGPDTPDAP